jgi:3-methyladenine DNA glycosylase AlkD
MRSWGMADKLDPIAEREAIVGELRSLVRPYRGGQSNDSYTGSGRPFFNVSIPDQRRIVRTWLKAHKRAGAEQVLGFADALFAGDFYEEKILGALVLGSSAGARRLAQPAMVDGWLAGLNGWAEVDSLCASVFGPDELLADWPAWRLTISRLSRDQNVNKRRAALVLLTRPCRLSHDPRFGLLAFEIIDRLKSEREPMVTKAISWLLRSNVARRAREVDAYLEANRSQLPAIAVRETRNKLATGVKSGRRPAAGAR